MKLKALSIVCVAAVCASALLITSRSAAQPGSLPPKIDKKTMFEEMAKAGAPAPEHAKLDMMTGEFDIEYEFSAGPGIPPLTAKGHQKSEWILGKRFVQTISLPAAGEDMKIEAMTIFGYDKRTKKYFWFGIDSSDTYSVFAQGDWDEANKTFTLKGENQEPQMGKVPFRVTITRVDDSHSTFKIEFQMQGAPGADKEGWFPVMNAKRTRVK